MVDPTPKPVQTLKISEIDESSISFNPREESITMLMDCSSAEIAQLEAAHATGYWVNISISSQGHFVAATQKETIRLFEFIGRVVSIDKQIPNAYAIKFHMYGNPTISRIEL